MKKLGNRIARQRKAAGFSQARLAEEVNVTPESISRIEGGHLGVSFALLRKLADALGVRLHELVRWQIGDEPKDHLVDDLLVWASRMSFGELELVMELGAVALEHTRRMVAKQRP